MKQTIKTIIFLAVMILTAGQAIGQHLGYIICNPSDLDGGSLAFYKGKNSEQGLVNQISIDATTHKSGNLSSSDLESNRVYILATADETHQNYRVTITVEKKVDSGDSYPPDVPWWDDEINAPQFRAPSNNELTVTPVSYGIYYFEMPDDGSNVQVSATFPTKTALTITADSDTKNYDGTALTKNSYTYTGLVEGDVINSVTITGSQTNVGSSNNVPSAAVIKDANNVDVTDCYSITYVNGTLTVNACQSSEAVVALDIPTEGYTYDGTEKTPAVTVTIGTMTVADTEYTVSYTNNVNAGTASVTVEDKQGGNFAFTTQTTAFEIGKKSLTDNDVVVGISKVNNTYQVSVTRGKETLVEGTDYTLGEGAGQTSGSNYNYSIPVTGKGNYSGEVTATWSDAIAAYTVNVIDANNAEVSSVEVGTETTTVTISGTVSDGTNDVPVTSIADGTFTTENTANVQSIDLSETQVDLDMDRKADDSPVKDVPDNTLIYLPAGSTMTGDNVIVKGVGSSFTCNNFVMDDEKSYNVPHPFTASNATLNREFTANQTCTVCLPYDVPAAGVHGKIYTFTSVANNQVTMTEDNDGLNANVPYIFVPDGTDNISVTGSITVKIVDNNTSANDFTFKGIYEDHKFTAEEIAKGVFGFAGANAVGATPGHFAKAATGAYIKAKRAYLEYTGSATNPDIEGPDVPSPRFGDLETPLPNSMDVILVDADGTTTNIGKLELVDNDDNTRYNLSGQRVGKGHKGIVIKNSKKVVIK